MNNSFFDEMHKIADEKQVTEDVREHPAMTAAKGVGGFALGAGAGYVGAHGLNKAVEALRGPGKGIPPKVIRYGAPIAGATAAMGYNLLQHQMMERMKKNMQPKEADSDGLSDNSSD